jgi:hypothetical protein
MGLHVVAPRHMDQLNQVSQPETEYSTSFKQSEYPLEAVLSSLSRLSAADREKVLEFIELLLEADRRKAEFNRLQRPLFWAY